MDTPSCNTGGLRLGESLGGVGGGPLTIVPTKGEPKVGPEVLKKCQALLRRKEHVSPPNIKFGHCKFRTAFEFIWVWVKIKAPGYGPQVLVHVSTCQGNLANGNMDQNLRSPVG